MADGKKKYRATRNLKYDGRLYGPGKLVDLTDAQAAPLLACKAVEAAADAKQGGK